MWSAEKRSAENKIKILFCSCSLGIINRGIESFFREAFDNLIDESRLDLRLVKGRGPQSVHEIVVRAFALDKPVAGFLGRMFRRSPYTVHQWSGSLHVLWILFRWRPDLIFTSDGNLVRALRLLGKACGVRVQIVFSNGGPCDPPFSDMDGVHQVAPYYLEQALAAGEPMAKHICVPYGFKITKSYSPEPRETSLQFRKELGIPVDRPVLLSVGWIAAQHKRMNYVVNEVASIGSNRPFLVLLGHIDESSEEIVRLAESSLGAGGFMIRSVPRDEVELYYRCADAFVLASLKEGFGRVYVEALAHGLPVIAHDHPVVKHVLGPFGTFCDMGQPGVLAQTITSLFEKDQPERCETAAAYARERFAWEQVRASYVDMFEYFARQ